MQTQTIFDFSNASNIENWVIVDDGVMGGKSSGDFKLNNDGYGTFFGSISLENNGGFSSVRYRGETIKTLEHTEIILRVKGDGKRYQFRIKDHLNQQHSYVTYFNTSGNWETIEIKLNDLMPKFRGRHLDMPNFSATTIAELGFLFGNKKLEDFKLLIAFIGLQ
ncbi:CIA30 family protein [Jejuia pallidilutea]|uniref:NADH:ubiquinone oxidoreductase intermediate-associated protein 30 domain-containing protein n=1 Tax=Jejuia pallidilutea TaxID=504487 RepID=A0A090WIZ2_9FLAO|nr:CIA30 family protein [Jejuia pallidilutea]GAL67447.1 hypothetical protein JCM19301_420 [Jejuia pallidilutea]GAL71246.1 hypothetical protein JCM19302_923 [Jejuia pallidilutea]GAL88769.1 hypothetical protein JCM19538_1204 [Jejuia pallidilutea]